MSESSIVTWSVHRDNVDGYRLVVMAISYLGGVKVLVLAAELYEELDLEEELLSECSDEETEGGGDCSAVELSLE